VETLKSNSVKTWIRDDEAPGTFAEVTAPIKLDLSGPLAPIAEEWEGMARAECVECDDEDPDESEA
jgi:hypothetical protein